MSHTAALVLVGSAVGGFISGLAGFAFGLVAMVFWAWTIKPQLIGPMLVVGSLSGQLLTIRTVRHSIRPAMVWPFIAGGVIGVPVGASLLPYMDPLWLRMTVGALLFVYCPLMLWSASLPGIRWGGRKADGAIGAVAGVLGGVAGLIGPVPTLWCILRNWPKDVQRAVCQSFFIAMQSLTLVVYLFNGLLTGEVLRLFALLLPTALISAGLGARLYVQLSDLAFRRVLLIILFFTGTVLLASALWQWLHAA
ncbi:MAG: sulfite exporter TauE/SafE family protein [Burkholderiales bacterium]|nr:sulfite exporter TauE/SafE family protein [Burkholderiales bacterium]